jgi:ABC-type Na+ efflux pump permease subunit
MRSVNTQTSKTVAVLCIAVVVFAAFLPAVAVSLPPVILTALWLVIPAVAVAVIRREAVRCDEQPVSLLSLVLSRAPPSKAALA